MLTPIKNDRQPEKPIFSSETYLDSLIAFCDLCFSIIDVQKEFYFLCQTCDNFAACLACIKNRNHRLIPHAADHLFYADKPFSNNHWTNRNLFVTCHVCNKTNFSGKRYRCRQCIDFDVCSNCLNQAELTHSSSNEKHLFDFIPNPTKICLNRQLLAQRTIQILRYRNANVYERDSITGWTSEEAEMIAKQTLNLCGTVWENATELFTDEDLETPPNIIEHEKIDKTLITIADS